MTAKLPPDMEALVLVIDVLWSFLPAAQVAEIRRDYPEIYATCQLAHRLLNHRLEDQ